MERYFHAHENARREIEGREPLPELPYTEEDREDDMRFLEEIIPAYRAGPGWQTEEAQAVLDAWEQHTREKLAKGAVQHRLPSCRRFSSRLYRIGSPHPDDDSVDW
jgi:hypothetical protein